ncbi:hypothetical protein B0H11DRAFT_656653 [Mycena galericulata]|nr:hypothetical protein B0H11DRAFT_656653 [Mycena galericulata]
MYLFSSGAGGRWSSFVCQLFHLRLATSAAPPTESTRRILVQMLSACSLRSRPLSTQDSRRVQSQNAFDSPDVTTTCLLNGWWTFHRRGQLPYIYFCDDRCPLATKNSKPILDASPRSFRLGGQHQALALATNRKETKQFGILALRNHSIWIILPMAPEGVKDVTHAARWR